MSSSKTHQLSLSVNGRRVELDVEPRSTLAGVLREECGLTGTKLGCEQGSCGACTVIFDGQQIRSCLMFAIQANDCEVWTIEGLAQPATNRLPGVVPLPNLPALADAFKRNHALQCGFCTPGMLIAAASLGQNAGGDLDEKKIKEGLSGNICRCTGYQGIIESITEVFIAETPDLAVEAPK